MKKNIAFVCGGKSPEHEISIRSIKNIVEALDRNRFDATLIMISKEGSWYHASSPDVLKSLSSLSDKTRPAELKACTLAVLEGHGCLYVLDSGRKITLDAVFPVMHGSFGEDGTLQGMIRMMGLPLVGCDVLASAAGMDKDVMKRLFKEAQIPSSKYILLTQARPFTYQQLVDQLGSPFFIKPANAGSSVGAHKIKNSQDFKEKLQDSFRYDGKVLAEEFMEGREVECSVLGHSFTARASVPGEIIPQHEFYSYEAKYLDDNGAIIKIPADLRPDTQKQIQELAVKVFETFLCEGMTRVDFFVRKKDGQVFVNELNTIPGFTSISMYPKMWEASGLSYKNLISQLIDLGLEKYQADQKVATNYLDL